MNKNWTRLIILTAVTVVVVIFGRSEEHTSELQSQFPISYAVFCLKKKKKVTNMKNLTEARYNLYLNQHQQEKSYADLC